MNNVSRSHHQNPLNPWTAPLPFSADRRAFSSTARTGQNPPPPSRCFFRSAKSPDLPGGPVVSAWRFRFFLFVPLEPAPAGCDVSCFSYRWPHSPPSPPPPPVDCLVDPRMSALSPRSSAFKGRLPSHVEHTFLFCRFPVLPHSSPPPRF